MACGQGLTVKRVAKSRNAIYFSGKACAGGVGVPHAVAPVQAGGETHFANATEIQVPAGIASVLLNVRGLNNFRSEAAHEEQRSSRNTRMTSSVSFLTPGDWATIYDVMPIYNAGYDGTGATWAWWGRLMCRRRTSTTSAGRPGSRRRS